MTTEERRGPVRFSPELMMMATKAMINRGRSWVIRASSLRSAAQLETLASLCLLRLYSMQASLRVIDLYVFRRGFQQLAVGPGGDDLSFHQEDDLLVVFHGG